MIPESQAIWTVRRIEIIEVMTSNMTGLRIPNMLEQIPQKGRYVLLHSKLLQRQCPRYPLPHHTLHPSQYHTHYTTSHAADSTPSPQQTINQQQQKT